MVEGFDGLNCITLYINNQTIEDRIFNLRRLNNC